MGTRATAILAVAVLASFVAREARATDPVIHACVKNIGGGLRIVAAGETCSPSETALEWNIQGPHGPTGPQGPPGPPAAESTACSGDVASVTTGPTPETCVTKNYPCTPYTCDAEADTCGTSCINTADCAQGASCDTIRGKCASVHATCFDGRTILSADGLLVSCSPYECTNGFCQQQCVHTADCADGFTCVQSHCVE
jgi:hypothetical protein